MSKSYKMVVLLYMLSKGADRWLDPITPEEAASFFHQYLTEKNHRRQIDFSDKQSKKLWEYDQGKVSKLIADMPMTKWSSSGKKLVSFSNNIFKINLDVDPDMNARLYEFTKEICEYRLHWHFERKGKS